MRQLQVECVTVRYLIGVEEVAVVRLELDEVVALVHEPARGN